MGFGNHIATASTSATTNTSINSKETTPVQVAVRVRPLTSQDRAQPRFSQSTESDVIKTFESSITVVPQQKAYSFDQVFDTESTQEQVFTAIASKMVDRFMDGYNVTILAYGQTSSGKTYTMGTEIDDNRQPEHEGIIPRAMAQLFQQLHLQQHPYKQSQQSHHPQHHQPSTKLKSSRRPISTTGPAGGSGLRTPGSTTTTNGGNNRRIIPSPSNPKLRPSSMITPLNTSNSNGSNGSSNGSSRRGSTPTLSNAPGNNNNTKTSRHTVKVSFVEIYNEELVDLLNPSPPTERPPVTIREDTKGQIYWTGVKEVTVESTEDVLRYLQMGTLNRATGSTDMNAKSSRSHAIFSVTLKQEKWIRNNNNNVTPKPSISTHVRNNRENGPTPTSSRSSMIGSPMMNRRSSTLNVRAMIGQMEKRQNTIDEDHIDDDDGKWVVSNSKFHFVDLAGSERLKRTAAEGDRRKEGININAGLLALGNVISALSEPSKRSAHIPYRDSKLTRLLQDSLGGNATTLMIACISPAEVNLIETVNTIKYAHRARSIKNKVERNEAEEWMTSDNPDFLRSIINKLKNEVRSLKSVPTSQPLSPKQPLQQQYPQHQLNGNLNQYISNGLPSQPQPSCSISDIDASHPISTCGSSSATTTITVPDANDLDNQALVADLRRQIEELQNEVTVTRERNQLVETELRQIRYKNRKKNTNSSSTTTRSTGKISDVSDMDFQHLVEPVIEEYEKSISSLESQLAMVRAALSHSDQVLADQESKITTYESARKQEQKALVELKSKLSKSVEREQTSEGYIAELEGKLAKSVEEAMQDQHVLNDLKTKIVKLKDMDESTESYINELEGRLTTSEKERDRLVKLADEAQERLVEQDRQLENIKHRLSMTEVDATQKLLLEDLDKSQDRCRELEQELATLRESLYEQQKTPGDDDIMQDGNFDRTRELSHSSSTSTRSLKDELQHDKELQQIKEHLVLKTSQIDALEEQILQVDTASKKKIVELEEKVQMKQAQIQELEGRLTEVETIRDEFVKSRDEQANEINRLEECLASSRRDLDASQAELHAQRLHNDQMQQSTSAKITELESQIQHTTTVSQDSLDEALEQKRQLEKTLQEQERQAHQALSDRLEELEHVRADMHNLILIQTKQDMVISSLEHKIQAMEILAVSLREQLAERDRQIAQLENDNNEKDRVAHDLQDKVQKILHDIDHVGQERQQLDKVIEYIETSLRKQDDKAEKTSVALQDLQSQYAVCEADLQSKIQTIQALEDEKKSMSDALMAMTNKAKQSSHMVVSLSEQIEDMEQKSEELEDLLRKNCLERDAIHEDLEGKKSEMQEVLHTLEKQNNRTSMLEITIQQLEDTIKTERQLVADNDMSGLVSELRNKLLGLTESKQKMQHDYEIELEQTRRINLDQENIIQSLESSLQAMQTRLEEAVQSHSQKSDQIQSLQEQLNNRRRLTIDTNTSRDSGLPDERRMSNLVKRVEELEREKQKLLLTSSRSTSTNNDASISTTSNEDLLFIVPDDTAQNSVQKLQDRFRAKLHDTEGQEELLEKLMTLMGENSHLSVQVNDLEAQLVLQRSQLQLESKNLELEVMKLSAANERLEKEMEQALPRSQSNTSGNLSSTNQNRDSLLFSSPPQTPRVASPPPNTAPNTLHQKLQRDLSTSSLVTKLQKSGSVRSVAAVHYDYAVDETNRRASTNSMIRPMSSQSSSRYRAQSTGTPTSSPLSPPTAPPTNPLPPIPSPSLSTIPTSSTNTTTSLPPPARSVSTPLLQRQSSCASTTISEIINSNGNFTSDQYEKIIRSLQRKAQVADTDVRAHQEVISKLEAQLSRSENAVRDVKRQLETLSREKQTYILEMENLKNQVARAQDDASVDFDNEEIKKLQDELSNERVLKEKAEKARRILEHRMEELMSKRNKFMCF
ncbi:hypothetical protein INT45_005120 [Circinella minor]|uniref:Kinesin motor domain-containing protein n=1 Tax=Circinella minor TaxID=1195481 RepID=A0A8H7SAC6_9FUNG|nr:hypothetical protein INT45_005120 [Circinella minor]